MCKRVGLKSRHRVCVCLSFIRIAFIDDTLLMVRFKIDKHPR